MKNNKGISLTETIITLGVLGVLASIAVVNFGSHRDPVEKRELFQSAKVWSMQVKNCLLNFSSMGGWEVRKRLGLSAQMIVYTLVKYRIASYQTQRKI